ncbi:MAG: Brp/Blh family beta-carotene 15,15'-dioxygenase [Lunatimonas sp.]|uniref:Brp/Blh family beta-carotene 15,15'-dioxygenase n=1 Tax=Lunatimonas sp. TaxID=2060141 RepID=UPI00263A81AD|nr:Brp/Blh family beta-carotene 15,15'-dioxygenase [Lunatimonas sp.]MCC5937047.1 Brp/Blh family beta-carotene 15,15'-dioxygenase [Lunatimonas sp.]
MKNIDIWGKTLGFAIAIIYFLFFQSHEMFEWLLFIVVLLTVGIPHGAVDHLLVNPHIQRKDLAVFILKYLAIIVLYLLVWVTLPLVALISFLLMSAYHFGQSHYIRENLRIGRKLTYLGTGTFYLAVILFGNFSKTAEILASIVDISGIANFGPSLTVLSFSLVAVLLVRNLPTKSFLYLAEMTAVGIILFHLPLLVGFILYFGFWHALPSMAEEYQSLRKSYRGVPLTQFILRMLPFTAASIIGMGIILVILYPTNTTQELTLLFFVLVSLISAPHIWYMNGFLESRR